jgi:energy-coupling factor transporter ATP-binding protein EcfA2
VNAESNFGLNRVGVRGFRSAVDVSFAPGRLCALIGEANAGKSNLLLAIRALLDPVAATLEAEDVLRGGDGRIVIEGSLAGGGELVVAATPPAPPQVLSRTQTPPVASGPTVGSDVGAAQDRAPSLVSSSYWRRAESPLDSAGPWMT